MKDSIKITLIYAFFAALWIIFSDQALLALTHDSGVITFVSSVKGVVFVLATGVLLFLLINRDIKSRNAVIQDLNALLKVKDQLNKELHHRIKNNLQVVISLLGIETDGNDFSEKARDRIVNRLISMVAVYNVVYNFEDMTRISLQAVLSEYEKACRRRIVIGEIHEEKAIPIEMMVTLFIVVDAVVESLAERGYVGDILVRSLIKGTLEIRIPKLSIDASSLVGPQEAFLISYLSTIEGSLEILIDDMTTIRILY